jgi:predicted GIY-YIG superfamily endonuclease
MSTSSSTPKAKAPKPKAETRMTKVDWLRQTWIYLLLDPHTKKVIYVGKSVDMENRLLQHGAKKDSGIKTYLKRKKLLFRHLVMKKVPELPKGCAAVDADRFEAYFIAKYKTMYDMFNNEDACNNNNGNYARRVDRDVTTKELEKGYEWPEGCAAQVAELEATPKDLLEARANKEILSSLALEYPDLEEEIRGMLIEAEQTLQDLQTGPYDRAKEAYETYCEKPPHELVPRDDLMATVNGIKDLTPEDPAVQHRWRKVWTKLMHSDSNKTTISVFEAMFIMGTVMAWLGDHAETKLTLTTKTAKWCLKLREWMAAQDNDGKPPSMGANSRASALANVEAATQEASLGEWMTNWKNKYGKPEPGTVRVLLRHWPKVLASLLGKSRAEKTLDLARRANALLKAGYAQSIERTARPAQSVDLKPLVTTTDGDPVYKFVFNFLDGGNPAMADTLLEGVDADRAKWMRDTNVAKQSDYKKKMRQHDGAQTKRRQAVTKKRKEEGESSTAPECEAQNDSDSDNE